jgi:alpha-galactosidase
VCDGFDVQDFKLKDAYSVDYSDARGHATRWILKGELTGNDHTIAKLLHITVFDSLPSQAFYKAYYINHSSAPITVKKWVSHAYQLFAGKDSIPFWSFQGESTGERRDWVLPIRPGFKQRNFMGMNSSDYGGGIPVTDVWSKDYGVAIGHSELHPLLISLPVSMDSASLTCHIHVERSLDGYQIPAGDTLELPETFVQIHHGDYYHALSRYGKILRSKGLAFLPPNEEAFEASWCAWGYMRDVTLEEIKGTLPKVRALGIRWVTIDDGFQQAEGDWHVNTKKFPKGDSEMRALIDDLHRDGFKVMLWWAPLAVDPNSRLLEQNPDIISTTADGKPHLITWWESYYMAPSYIKTQQHTKDALKLFLSDWNVDGLKMDGQHLNAVHPDYATNHGLKSPEEAFEIFPGFFKLIHREAERLKPGSLLQLCPCGTCMSVFNMPYMNQAVASDPLSSWQVRLKGKTYKAITPTTAYFADHVELSDNRSDFASALGIGAVPGTKFTWPKENPSVKEDNLLSPSREEQWKKWLTLYNKKMLSKGEYLGALYDIGYDLPETHVVKKGDTLHYAFYAKSWKGPVELRGLDAAAYNVRDYVNNIEFGEVTREKPVVQLEFKGNLLLEVYPTTK